MSWFAFWRGSCTYHYPSNDEMNIAFGGEGVVVWHIYISSYLTVDKIQVQIRCMGCKKRLRHLLKVESLQVDFKRRNVAFGTLTRWTPMKILERESRWKVVCNKRPDTKLVAVYGVACKNENVQKSRQGNAINIQVTVTFLPLMSCSKWWCRQQ